MPLSVHWLGWPAVPRRAAMLGNDRFPCTGSGPGVEPRAGVRPAKIVAGGQRLYGSSRTRAPVALGLSGLES
jgi:hypothetical protein